MSFFRKKETPKIPYDAAAQQPAVRRSICTGEMTVGFIDRESGRFQDYMLARNTQELLDFCNGTGITPEQLKTVY